MNKRMYIILGLGVCVVLALFVFYLIKSIQSSQSSTPAGVRVGTPTPYLSPAPVTPTIIVVPPSYPPTPTSSPDELKSQLISLMPIVTPEFNIEYFVLGDYFLITIAESPYDANKAKADQWFIDHGVTDLSQLTIQYAKYRFVQ